MALYLQGVNLSGDTPCKEHFRVIMAIAWGLFFEAIPAPYIYTKMLKSYLIKEVLIILWDYLWFGVFFDFLMMVFKCMAYPRQPKKKTSPVFELSEK